MREHARRSLLRAGEGGRRPDEVCPYPAGAADARYRIDGNALGMGFHPVHDPVLLFRAVFKAEFRIGRRGSRPYHVPGLTWSGTEK